MGVLVRELAALYAAFAAGRPSPLPELPVQYADFAVWQRELAARRGARRRSSPTGGGSWPALPPLLELPTDRPRPAVQTLPRRPAVPLRARRRRWPRRSRRSAAREGATLFMALLAAFQALLAALHRRRTTSRSARRSPAATARETEGLIGFFVNTLVLRADLAGDPSFRELLARVRETALGAYAHQDLPFEQLVEELQPEREPRPHAAVPGDVRAPERAAAERLDAAGPRAWPPAGAPSGNGQVRPHARR